MFTSGSEFVGAVIDLLISLLLIPLLIILYKTEGNTKMKNRWIHFIGVTSVAHFIGAIIHAFNFKEYVKDIIWIFEYLIVYNIALSFFIMSINKLTEFDKPIKKTRIILFVITICASIASSIYGFFTIKDVRIFAIFAALVDLPALIIFIIMAVKYKDKGSAFLFLALPIQLLGLIMQLKRNINVKIIFEFDHNSLYHICLLFTMIIFYFTARIDIKNNTNKLMIE